MTAFPTLSHLSSGRNSRSAHIDPDASCFEEDTSPVVLVVYQPVFHHHANKRAYSHSPSTSRSPVPSPGSADLSQQPLAGFGVGESTQHGVLHQNSSGEEDSHPLLDIQHSRPIDVLQNVGRKVAEHLATCEEYRMRRDSKINSGDDSAFRHQSRGTHRHPLPSPSFSTASSCPALSSLKNCTINVDCISILPASYIRSTHHFFAQPHQTAFSRPAASLSNSPGDREENHSASLFGRGPTDNLDYFPTPSRNLRKKASQSRASSMLAHVFHPSHAHSNEFPSQRTSFEFPDANHDSASGSGATSFTANPPHHASSTPKSGTERLLELTDDLRVEDEAGEEAREQILDRLTVLAGELESEANCHEGIEFLVSTDVEQANDGEILEDAIVRLAESKAYIKIVVLNDLDWSLSSAALQKPDAKMDSHAPVACPLTPAQGNKHESPLSTDYFTAGPVSSISACQRSRVPDQPGLVSALPGHLTPSSSGDRSPSPAIYPEAVMHTKEASLPSHLPQDIAQSHFRKKLGHLASSLHPYHDDSSDHDEHLNHGHASDRDLAQNKQDNMSHHAHGHHHLFHLTLHFSLPHLPHPSLSRAARTSEKYEQAEVRRVLIFKTDHLIRRLKQDMNGVQVISF